MAKTNKILFSIKEQCTGKLPSNDTRLQDRFILHQMNSVRGVLLKEEFERRGRVSESFYQLKCCIEVVCDKIKCGGYDSGDKIFYARIPKLMDSIGDANITYFGNTEFGKIRAGLHNNFDRYNMPGYLSLEYQEWVGRRPAYTVVGGYKDEDTIEEGNVALIKNMPTSGGRFICVNGVFENPEEGLCDEDDIMEMEYPMPGGNMIHKLELIVIRQILSTEGVPADDINNAKDNTANAMQSQQQKPVDINDYE